MLKFLSTKKEEKKPNVTNTKPYVGNTREEETTFNHYCVRGQIDKAEEFIQTKQGFKINQQGGWNRTPLHWSAVTGQTDMTTWLLRAGCLPVLQDVDGCTPIHLAALNGHLSTVKELLRKSNKTIKNKWNQTPFDVAKTDEIKKLLDPSPEKNSVQLIVDNKHMDVFDSCEMGDVNSLKAICSQVASSFLNSEGAWKRSPLHYSAMTGNSETASLLLTHGAKADPLDETGWSPLHWASNNGHLDVVLLLLKHGANRKLITTDSNKTAHDLAANILVKNALESNSTEVFNFLRSMELDNYCKVFTQNELTMEVISSLEESDLKDMQLPIGARKKIIAAIAKMKGINRGESNSSNDNNNNSNSSNSGNDTEANIKRDFMFMEGIYVKDIQIQEKVGGGAFGQVYKGTWAGTSVVALKKLSNPSSVNSAREFEAEMKVLRNLRHPNVILLYGLYMEDKVPYICMEFCNGGSLEKLLHTDTLTFGQKVKVAMDSCAGMIYLSSNHIIHRDLATRNLLVADNFIIKVGDFGMSRITDDGTYSATTKRFPVKWTAPEAIQFGKFSIQSDVYSFGVVLWEIFSNGAIPWGGLSSQESIECVLKGEKLSQPEGCTQEIYALMNDCWKKEPAARPDWKIIFATLSSLISEPAAISKQEQIPAEYFTAY